MVLKIVKDLDIQASKLKKRGRINRMNKILKRRNFIEKQIKLTKQAFDELIKTIQFKFNDSNQSQQIIYSHHIINPKTIKFHSAI